LHVEVNFPCFPIVIGFAPERGDEAEERGDIGEDAGHARATFDLWVDAFHCV